MNGINSFYLGAMFFFLVDVLQKITSQQQHTWKYIFVRSIFTASFSLVLTIIVFGFEAFPAWSSLWSIVGACMICTLGLYFYIKSVHALKFSNVGALSIVGNVFQQIVGYVILKEAFQVSDIFSMALMSFGCILQILLANDFKGARYVVASSLCWNLGYILLSRVMQDTAVAWTVPIMECSVLFTSGIMILFQKKAQSQSFQVNKQYPYLMLIAVLVFFGSYLNNHTYKHLPVSTISILQLSLMPIGFLLSMKIFRERPNKVEWISFVTGFLGFAWYVVTHQA